MEIPQLVASLGSKDEAVQAQAAHVLAKLARNNPASQQAILAAGPIRPLVGLLRSNNEVVQANAAGALCVVSGDNPAPKREMFEAGAIPPLVGLLGSTNEVVQAHAAGVVQNLAGDTAEIRAALGTAGAIPPLVALLGSSRQEMQARAAGALRNLVIERANNDEAVRKGAIPLLVALENSSNDAVMEAAAAALVNLRAAGNRATQDAIAGARVMIISQLRSHGLAADVPALNDKMGESGWSTCASSAMITRLTALAGMKRLVEGLGELLLSPYSNTPLTIGITAPWGAGKSSLMRQVSGARSPDTRSLERSAVNVTPLPARPHSWSSTCCSGRPRPELRCSRQTFVPRLK